MPMTYTIDAEPRLVRLVGTGRLTDDEMVQCIQSLRSDPKLEPDMSALADMRGIDVGFTSEGVSRMIHAMEATADRRSRAKAAIVVSSDVAFGMARMVEIQADKRVEPSFKIFRDMDEARRWLGLD